MSNSNLMSNRNYQIVKQRQFRQHVLTTLKQHLSQANITQMDALYQAQINYDIAMATPKPITDFKPDPLGLETWTDFKVTSWKGNQDNAKFNQEYAGRVIKLTQLAQLEADKAIDYITYPSAPGSSSQNDLELIIACGHASDAYMYFNKNADLCKAYQLACRLITGYEAYQFEPSL